MGHSPTARRASQVIDRSITSQLARIGIAARITPESEPYEIDWDVSTDADDGIDLMAELPAPITLRAVVCSSKAEMPVWRVLRALSIVDDLGGALADADLSFNSSVQMTFTHTGERGGFMRRLLGDRQPHQLTAYAAGTLARPITLSASLVGHDHAMYASASATLTLADPTATLAAHVMFDPLGDGRDQSTISIDGALDTRPPLGDSTAHDGAVLRAVLQPSWTSAPAASLHANVTVGEGDWVFPLIASAQMSVGDATVTVGFEERFGRDGTSPLNFSMHLTPQNLAAWPEGWGSSGLRSWEQPMAMGIDLEWGDSGGAFTLGMNLRASLDANGEIQMPLTIHMPHGLFVSPVQLSTAIAPSGLGGWASGWVAPLSTDVSIAWTEDGEDDSSLAPFPIILACSMAYASDDIRMDLQVNRTGESSVRLTGDALPSWHPRM